VPKPKGFGWAGIFTRVEGSTIDWSASARSAALVALPIGVAVTTNYVAGGVFAAIGCFNVLLLQFVGSADDRLWRSAWGLVLNTVAVGLGTLVGTWGALEIPLIALGLTSAHLVMRIPRAGTLILTVSALFVIGVGLPDPSIAQAGSRALLVLVGGALGLGGLGLHLWLVRLTGRPALYDPVSPSQDDGSSALASGPGAPHEWWHAIAVGVTAAGGFALALGGALPETTGLCSRWSSYFEGASSTRCRSGSPACAERSSERYSACS
jgi:hypothetical protein